MRSSLRIKAVNEIDTMWRNSFSKRTSDTIMIAAPENNEFYIVEYIVERRKPSYLDIC
jgi:hypothetical protein